MKQVVGGVLVLLLACLASQADDKSRDKPPTPREQFDALVKEHQNAQNAFFKALRGTSKPEEQQKRMKEEAPKLEKIMARFVELAEKAPKDPVAVDALLRVVQDNFADRAGGTSKKKALELLARDHVKSDKVGLLCQALGNGYDTQNETLLRAILTGNPSKAIQAEACLALALNLRQRAMLARRLAADPALVQRFAEFAGKETATALQKADPAKLESDGEKLSRQFADKYMGEMKPDRLVNLCTQLRFSPDKGSEALLRTLLAHDKREVQGVACVILAQAIKGQADESADKDAKRTAKLRAESETLFKRASEKYADVKMGFGGTVGETAEKELYELRFLAIGKPAPVVEGEDQDGKSFKLSDYKGKVVLLDFWSQF